MVWFHQSPHIAISLRPLPPRSSTPATGPPSLALTLSLSHARTPALSPALHHQYSLHLALSDMIFLSAYDRFRDEIVRILPDT